MLSLIRDCRRVIRPWADNPVGRLRLELLALRRAIIPHDENNNFRKLTLIVLLSVWVTITLGGPSGEVVNGLLYTILTALVFTIIGRQWGIEVDGIVPNIEIGPDDNDSDD